MRKIDYINKFDYNKLYFSKEDDGIIGYYTFERAEKAMFDIWRFTYVSKNPSKHSCRGGRDEANLKMHINNRYITNVWECSPEEKEEMTRVLMMMELVD